MPLVRISLLKGKSARYRRSIGDAIHQALAETIAVPAKDSFQLIGEHEPEEFIYDPVCRQGWKRVTARVQGPAVSPQRGRT